MLSKKWWETPNTTSDRRRLNPRYAESDPERRICTLLNYKAFLVEYADALAQ